MRAILATGFLVIASLTSLAAEEEKYTSKDGKYKVQFPAGKKVVEDLKPAGGGIEMKLATVDDKEKAFVVMYMDLPAAAKNVESKMILEGAEKGSVQQSGGKLEDSKDIAFGKGKLPGREILVNKDGNKIKTWVIIDGTRVYVLAVGGPKDFATGKEATAFLNSFEITK